MRPTGYMTPTTPTTTEWAAASPAARALWAKRSAAHLSDDELRAAVLDTAAGRGPFAVAEVAAGDRRANLSRAAALARYQETRS